MMVYVFPPTSSSLPQQWVIGLASWVLQDGNYTEFEVGQRRQFALEFGYCRNRRLRLVDEASSRRCGSTGRTIEYDVTASLQVAATEAGQQHMYVLDFGILAYRRQMVLDNLEPPPAGAWLSGALTLSVDPFDYMDLRMRPDGLPPMIYTWTIQGIERDATPPMQIEHGHPLYTGPDHGPKAVADPAEERWEPVPWTPLWDDAFYRLRCSLESHKATDTMAASGPQSPYGPMKSASANQCEVQKN